MLIRITLISNNLFIFGVIKLSIMKKEKYAPPPIFSVKKVKEDRYIIVEDGGNFYVTGEYYKTYDEALDRVIDLNLLVRK